MKLFDHLINRDVRSANKAKERVRLMLIHDRTDLSSEAMDKLKDDLIGTISRHVEIDVKAAKIEMTQDGRQQRLIADIPLLTIRKRRLG